MSGCTDADCTVAFGTTVSPGTLLTLSAGLGVHIQNGTADYSQTFQLTATGEPFASASGVFLTTAPAASAAPEPDTVALLASGIFALGVAAWRKGR